MADGGGGAARAGSANTAPAISAVEPFSRSRRENLFAIVALLYTLKICV
jgi:hypothetical protein